MQRGAIPAWAGATASGARDEAVGRSSLGSEVDWVQFHGAWYTVGGGGAYEPDFPL